VQASVSWETTAKQVEKEFLALSNNRPLVESALSHLRTWLEEPIYAEFRSAILGHISAGQWALLLDSFYQLIPFGTGGRRGRVGFGPNRINNVTVAMSVQGHCNFLRTQYGSDLLPIVVAFDTREFTDIAGTYKFLGKENPLLGLSSRKLARIACEIYAANGCPVWVPGLAAGAQYLSTPELSFAIRHLKATGGINVSASHNHPDDNGFKFFNQEGAQDIPPTDQHIIAFMEKVDEIRRMPFDDGVQKGLIRDVPPDLHTTYLSLNLALRSKPVVAPVHVMYTPLCGTGDSTVGDVLRAAGHRVDLFAPQANFDGSFASVPFRMPNPELPEVMHPALAEAKARDADVLLSTDPDADRLGLYAKDRDGSWHYLNGNEIAAVLAFYLVADRELGPQRKGIIIKTLVTTRMLESIAQQGGCRIVPDLLVGFKYIAHVLALLEREGRYDGVQGSADELVLAGEESHGILLTPKIRDKDAAGGALVLCELLSQLRAAGKTLPAYLEELAEASGNYVNLARGIVMRGIRGAQLLASMMRSLRDDPPQRFGDFAVREYEDFLLEKHGPLRSDTERLSRNLLLFRLDVAQITIRPSGTEPKAKIYVDLEGRKLADPSGAVAAAQSLAETVMDACIERIGFKLSASAKLLPDYVDLDLKAAFDNEFRQELLACAEALGQLPPPDRLRWLRQKLAPYGSGADPLEGAGRAVAHLCAELERETANPAIRQGLAAVRAAL
jgi:phosphoglucomutase/phosphomannomutase